MGRVRELRGCEKLSIREMVDDDLRRFMYEDAPDNVDDLRMAFKNQDMKKTNVSRRDVRFAPNLRKKLSKSKPHDVRRRRGLVMYGFAFLLLAITAAVLLPPPINFVMMVGCFVPLILSTIIMVRRNRTNRKHIGQQ